MVTVSGGAGGERALATSGVPRARGAISGILIVLLGIWGALIPFVGANFGYAYTPNENWTMTWGRLWLELVPGAVAIVCGLLLIGTASRTVGLASGWLAAAAGAWFAIGPVVSRLWTGQSRAGTPIASSTTQAVLEEVGMFIGLGVVIVFLAAMAVGRFSVLDRPARGAAEPFDGYQPRHGMTDPMSGQPTQRMPGGPTEPT